MEREYGRMKSVVSGRRLHFLALIFAVSFAAVATRSSAAPSNGTIDTYVGGGNGDGNDAVDATIDPRGIAVVGNASNPDIYVADGLNHRVRRVDHSSGIITTIAGTGVSGFSGDGGQAVNAQLWLPVDVAVDSAGNVYIADLMNNRIRKVGTDGRISTFAGNGQANYSGDNGLATSAGINSPYGVAVGPDGYVYIADYGNNRIRKVGPPGCTASTCVITTVAGNGNGGVGADGVPAINSPVPNPTDVAFDPAGSMYIAEYVNSFVRRVTPDGYISTVAGGGQYGPNGSVGDGGPGTSAVLNRPIQLDSDTSGNIYIADNVGHRIRMLTANTFIITTVAGNGNTGADGDGGAATNATIYPPSGVAATSPGTFWLSQASGAAVSGFNRVRKVALGIIGPSIGGGLDDGGAPIDALVDPHGSDAVDTGGVLPDFYFADTNQNLIRFVDGHTGILHNIAGTGAKGYSGDGGAATNATMNGPLDVAVDAVNHLVYIADTGNNVIRKIDRSGNISTVAGTGGYGFNGDGPATQVTLAAPRGVGLDSAGNLYIADHDNYRVRKLSNGQITTIAGNGQFGYSGDGSPAINFPTCPWDVDVGPDGAIYITDYDTSRIRRVTIGANGASTISTYAGGYNTGFGGDGGPANQAKLSRPTNLALDGAGDLFFADSLNYRVRVIDPTTQIINTVAGNGGTTSSGDGGPAIQASFGSPSGVAVDPSGSPLFVSASNTDRVRIVEFVQPSPTPSFTATPIAATRTATRTPTATPPPVSTPTATPPASTPTGTRTSTSGPVNVSVLGNITYYANSRVVVSGVNVAVSGPSNLNVSDDSSGNYSATMLAGGTWDVKPSKTGGFSNGVSSLDAARVLRVVAGLESFTPLQMLACDVTGDGTLSPLDASRILQFSAGLMTKFPAAQACGSDWLFYPSAAQVPGQTINLPSLASGVCQQGNILLQGLDATASNQNFSGILLGDCTGNWTPSGGSSSHSKATAAASVSVAGEPSSSATVRVGTLRHGRRNQMRLPVYVQSSAPFQALDLRIAYDASALTFTSADTHGPALHALTGVNSAEPGLLGISLASAKPLSGRAALLIIEFGRPGRSVGTGAELLAAQVDEHTAAVLTNGR